MHRRTERMSTPGSMLVRGHQVLLDQRCREIDATPFSQSLAELVM